MSLAEKEALSRMKAISPGPDGGAELIDKFNDCWLELSYCCENLSFAEGFRLEVRVAAESFLGSEGL